MSDLIIGRLGLLKSVIWLGITFDTNDLKGSRTICESVNFSRLKVLFYFVLIYLSLEQVLVLSPFYDAHSTFPLSKCASV